jgi:hypothetical protein
MHAMEAYDRAEILYVLILPNVVARSRWSVGCALLLGGKIRQNSVNRRLAGFQNRTWPLLTRVSNRNDAFVIDGVESSSFSACESIKRKLRSFSSVTHTKLSRDFVFILQSKVMGRYFLRIYGHKKISVSSPDLRLPWINNRHEKKEQTFE